MKFKKLVSLLILSALGTSIFADNIGTINNTNLSSILATNEPKIDLKNFNASGTKSTGLLNTISNNANSIFNKENMETMQPVLDTSLTVLKMIALYYVSTTVVMPAFAGLTGSLGVLFTKPVVANMACSNWAKYKMMSTLVLKNLGITGYHFTKFVGISMAMAYVQNKLQGEKEAQIA